MGPNSFHATDQITLPPLLHAAQEQGLKHSLMHATQCPTQPLAHVTQQCHRRGKAVFIEVTLHHAHQPSCFSKVKLINTSPRDANSSFFS